MINHPAMPDKWPDWECRNAAETAFRALVEWGSQECLNPDHYRTQVPKVPNLRHQCWKCWQTLKEAVKHE